MTPREIILSHLREPGEITFPHMELLARDHEPLIVVGSGVFRVTSPTEFEYEIRGTSPDVGHTLRALNRLRRDDYDGLNRFRIEMRDTDGVSWSGGWTIPDVDADCTPWRFTGTGDRLEVHVKGEPHSGLSEARFLIPKEFSASLMLDRFLRPNSGGDQDGGRVVEVLGVPVSFVFDRHASVLTVTAPFSAPFLPPYAENWFGEPLRILFGQLIYPRLFGRHFADGTSRLTLRPSPGWSVDSLWVSLWIDDDRMSNATGFFELYAGLLALVATNGDFEQHTVTEYYDQAIQAAKGSRWVMVMTLASSIEGLLRLLVPRGTLRPDVDGIDLSRLRDHIDIWDGPPSLKDVAKSRISGIQELSVQRALRDLAESGVGSGEGVRAWINVRNRVMHGELVSPYSSMEDDQIFVHLADLMRSLTHEVVRRASAST
jgi:hypothetical protein